MVENHDLAECVARVISSPAGCRNVLQALTRSAADGTLATDPRWRPTQTAAQVLVDAMTNPRGRFAPPRWPGRLRRQPDSCEGRRRFRTAGASDEPRHRARLRQEGIRVIGDKHLTIDEVSTIYRVPVATLRYWRTRGEGPRSFRLGRRVFYLKRDCDAWVEAAHTHHSVGGVA